MEPLDCRSSGRITKQQITFTTCDIYFLHINCLAVALCKGSTRKSGKIIVDKRLPTKTNYGSVPLHFRELGRLPSQLTITDAASRIATKNRRIFQMGILSARQLNCVLGN